MRQIAPVNNNGSIQLKFSFSSKRYSFSPIPGGDFNNSKDIAQAKAIATKITNDILAGYFDSTLDRYRLSPKAAPKSDSIATKPTLLLDLWDSWVQTLGLSEATAANHYKSVRKMIAKANPKVSDTAWLTNSDIAPRTMRDRLSLMRSCFRWGLDKGLVEANTYAAIKPKKTASTRIKPFSASEILAILDGFDSLAPNYSPFVRFLFLSGCRISEAIGLRWQDIDFDRLEVTIAESLSKDPCGNGYKRVRKETKTGSIRVLPMSVQLKATLEVNRSEASELVFTTPNGYTIDADNWRSRYWKPILKSANVPYRKIHNTRHTMISYALDQGIAPTGVAYLAGHVDTRMVLTTYGHMINKPNLPTMF